MIKISKLSGEMYQINDEEIPVGIDTVKDIIASVDGDDKVLEQLTEETPVEIIEKIANRGTVVNIYEVDYPAPSDPNKETQEMASRVDEYNDFVTQNLFPGVSAEDIVVEMRQPDKQGPGKLFNEQELRDKAHQKKSWRQKLL